MGFGWSWQDFFSHRHTVLQCHDYVMTFHGLFCFRAEPVSLIFVYSLCSPETKLFQNLLRGQAEGWLRRHVYLRQKRNHVKTMKDLTVTFNNHINFYRPPHNGGLDKNQIQCYIGMSLWHVGAVNWLENVNWLFQCWRNVSPKLAEFVGATGCDPPAWSTAKQMLFKQFISKHQSDKKKTKKHTSLWIALVIHPKTFLVSFFNKYSKVLLFLFFARPCNSFLPLYTKKTRIKQDTQGISMH